MSTPLIVAERDAPAAPDTPAAAPEPVLTSVLYVVRRWPVVLRWALAGALVAGGLAALRPRQYVATAAFVPVSRSAAPSNVSSLVGSLGLSGLQSDSESPQFFADLLRSPELLLPIFRQRLPTGDREVRGQTLVDLYGGSHEDPAIREDRALDTVASRVIGTSITAKTGVVRLTVRTRWAAASQWLAQRLLDQLNAFNLENRRTQAGQERRFADGLLRARRDSLRLAESGLESFILRNREYGNSPTLTLEAERLRRETALQLNLLTSATSQYEDARLREVRDTPTIMTLEAPRLPVRPVPRNVVPLGVLGGVLGAAASILGLLFTRAVSVQRALGDPEAELLFASAARLRRRGRQGGEVVPAASSPTTE